MSDLRKGWTSVHLKDIATVFLGKTPAKSQYCSEGKNKIIKFRDLKSGYVDFSNAKDGYVIDKMEIISSLKPLHKNDVLITSAAHSGENIGKKCAYIKKIPDQFEGVFFTGELLNIRTEYNETLAKWAYLYFLSLKGFKEIQNAVKGVHLTAGRANLMQIDLAPLNEQHRIVAKLEKLLQKLGDCKERLKKIPSILKRFRQSVISAACSGRLTADWRERNPDVEPASELLKRIQDERKKKCQKESEKAKKEGRRKPKMPEGIGNYIVNDPSLPKIPKTWTWSHLQNLGELSRGKSKHRPRDAPKLFGGKYPFIQTGDVAKSGGRITKHTQTYNEVGLAQSRLFPSGTLCITIAANIAEVGILTYPVCFPDSIVGFIPEEGMFEVLFAMYYIKVVQNNLAAFAPATAQKNINLNILYKVPVPVPPIEEQQEIVCRVEALFKIANRIEERYKKARAYIDKLMQSILAKAFRGELVPQDPNDLPASVLLERIREERAKKQAQMKVNKKITRKSKGKRKKERVAQ